jgi:hypothetical protein
MWRVVTAICAAAVAAAVIVANLAPASARPAGPGAGSPHPSVVQHFTTGGPINPCILPSCRGGNFPGIARPAGPGPASPHQLMTQRFTMGYWKHPCDEPTCHHHHHHFYNNFAFFESNGPYVYQPEPDCWLWSHRLHRWIWVCGPNYPNY